MLNRVAASVREFDMIQSSFSKLIGRVYENLPPELLDAFEHDPAIVSATTRRSQSWRIVDDTHYHLIRHRDAFQNFLSGTSNSTPVPSGSSFHDPIASLIQTLEALEERKREIAAKVVEVETVLAKVEVIHVTVKKRYNETLSHTSVVYPEVSYYTTGDYVY